MKFEGYAEREAATEDGSDYFPGWVKRKIVGEFIYGDGLLLYLIGPDGRIWRMHHRNALVHVANKGLQP